MSEPLSAEEVRTLVTDLAKQPGFTERNTTWRARRDLRFRKTAVGIPRVRKEIEYRSPWLNEETHRWANRLIGAPIGIKTAAKQKGQEPAAQRGENFFYRVYWDFRRIRTVAFVNADQRAADHKVADGLGIRHIRLAPNALELLKGDKTKISELGERGFEGLPFILEAPDPICVYYEPDLSVVAEEGIVTFRKLKRMYPNMDYSANDDEFRLTSEVMDIAYDKQIFDKTVKVYHVETEDWIYDLLEQPNPRAGRENGLILNKYKNIFGRPAYAFDPGHVTGSDEPLYAYEPLIGGLFGIMEQWNQLGTLQQAAGVFSGVPMYYLARRKGATGEDPSDYLSLPSGEKKEFHFNWDTGEVEGLPEGYEPVPIKFETGIDLTRAKEDVRWEMQRYTFRDIADVEATSGYDRARMIEVQGFDLQPPLDRQADCWHEIFLLIAEAIKNMDIPVMVRTIPQRGEEGADREIIIKPEDFKDIDLAVSFSSVGASTRFALVESGLRQMAEGVLSETTFMSEYQGTDDVDRERWLRDRDRWNKIAVDQLATLWASFVQQVGAGMIAQSFPQPVPEQVPGEVERAPTPMPGVGSPVVQPTPPKPMGATPFEGAKGTAGR